jgi:hypothetical protein
LNATVNGSAASDYEVQGNAGKTGKLEVNQSLNRSETERFTLKRSAESLGGEVGERTIGQSDYSRQTQGRNLVAQVNTQKGLAMESPLDRNAVLWLNHQHRN